jgi:23S rRNA pseudouridine2604 synthase
MIRFTQRPSGRPGRKAGAPAKPQEGERLSKRVMQLKGCSRKEAEQYIEGGWVKVNGVVVEEPAHRVDQETITIDPGASLMNLTPVTLLLHKPPGDLDGTADQPAPAGRKGAPRDARALLTPQHHWAQDASGIQVLKRHFNHLEGEVPLETGASGLVVFTQDWRTTRKLVEDMAVMEHELMVEVRGEVQPEALAPIHRALKDERHPLPAAKVSVNSNTPESSRLRFAIKGAHPGLAAYLCEKADFEILSMRRTRLGRVTLTDLPEGKWRYLASHERF